MKRLSALLLAVLLLCSLSACSKSGSAAPAGNQGQPEKGLPVLYIDGNAYPVTVDDGIKGLEQVHDGVISLHSAKEYDETIDAFVLKYSFTKCRSDGTIEEDYHGARRVWLKWYGPSTYTDPAGGASYRELDVAVEGFPFSEEKVSSAEAFRALMEQNGFFCYRDEYYRGYTENGPIDHTTQAFADYIREIILSNTVYRYEIEKDPSRLEEIIKNDPEWWNRSAIQGLMQNAIRDGQSRIGCTVIVSFDKETCEMQTAIHLLATGELMQSWFQHWAPGHEKDILPY